MFYYMPTYVIQEENCVRNHSKELASFGKKALLVTGRHSAMANGAYQDVTAALEQENTQYVLYDKIDENPSVEMVMEAAEAGRSCGADFVIAIGGGSPMDAAKAIALMIMNRDSDEHVLYHEIHLRSLPVVCVPTTCGTGSEVTPYAVLTRHDLRTKQSISHKIFPKLALVDSRYIREAPQSIIANTGIDTLGHLIESYFNKKAAGYSRMLCEKGMQEWAAVKETLIGGERNAEALEGLMTSSSLAGMAISHTSTTLPHSLSYYLTYEKNVPHGKAVGTFLAAYLDNVEETGEKQKVLSMLGFGSSEELHGFIQKATGAVSMTGEEIKECVEKNMKSEKKLALCPFLVTEEKLRRMVEVSVIHMGV